MDMDITGAPGPATAKRAVPATILNKPKSSRRPDVEVTPDPKVVAAAFKEAADAKAAARKAARPVKVADEDADEDDEPESESHGPIERWSGAKDGECGCGCGRSLAAQGPNPKARFISSHDAVLRAARNRGLETGPAYWAGREAEAAAKAHDREVAKAARDAKAKARSDARFAKAAAAAEAAKVAPKGKATHTVTTVKGKGKRTAKPAAATVVEVATA